MIMLRLITIMVTGLFDKDLVDYSTYIMVPLSLLSLLCANIKQPIPEDIRVPDGRTEMIMKGLLLLSECSCATCADMHSCSVSRPLTSPESLRRHNA